MKWVSFERQKGWKEGDGNLLSLSYPNRLRQKECNYDFLVNWIFFSQCSYYSHSERNTILCHCPYIMCYSFTMLFSMIWYNMPRHSHVTSVTTVQFHCNHCPCFWIPFSLIILSLTQSIPIIQIHLINSSEMNVWKCSLDCNDNLTHHELIHKHVITRASRVEKNNHFDWVDIRNRNYTEISE